MAASGVSRAQANKRVRQEALRDQLANQGHVQHVIELINKISDFSDGNEIDSLLARRIEIAINARLRLVSKYLPDLKSVEHTGEVQTGLSELLALAAQKASDNRQNRVEKEVNPSIEHQDNTESSLNELIKQAESLPNQA